jgi:putative tricarboxylic transport membrane protein
VKLNDAVLGAVFLALSLLVLWNIRGFPNIPGQNIGPDAFPGLIAALLAGCSIALIWRGWQARPRQAWAELQPWTRSRQHVIAFGLTVVMLLVYIVAAETVGFLICGVAMLLALMLALRVRPMLALTIAPLATLFVHAVFYKGLRVPLPWGVLPVLY